jgi:hypothetical protein
MVISVEVLFIMYYKYKYEEEREACTRATSACISAWLTSSSSDEAPFLRKAKGGHGTHGY